VRQICRSALALPIRLDESLKMRSDMERRQIVNGRLRILLVLAAVMIATLLVLGVLILVTSRSTNDLW